MGEVWRARDTKLGRDVAIKVLPASLSENTERLNRFEQEAQAAGALNHPNILVIYHIGTHEGAPYIVSELLEGETLRERMAGSAFPQRKAIDYALQIAKGLAAAHDKGIVHRDIKPDNIFITDDGRVKILDFGLAKLTNPRDGVESQTEVPTRKVNTDPGTVMGTMGYMSPEQLKGQPADQRSDIFSFGAILYEMLSGKRAFRGNSMAETMSAILREDPPDLSETNRTISPALERVVLHCLEKNPAERFHSASDLAFALEALSGSGTNSGRTITVPAMLETGPKLRWLDNPRLWKISVIVLTLVVLALAAVILLRRVPNAIPAALIRFDIQPANKSSVNLTRYPALALSPDGSTLAFLAMSDGISRIYLRKEDDVEVRALPGTEHASEVAFSPDGQSLAFIADRALKKVSLNGPVVVLTKVNGDSRGLSWGPNDNLVYSPAADSGLFLISAGGGEPRQLTTADSKKNERTHRWPQVLPDGKSVIFTVGWLNKPDDYENANIEAVVLSTGERRLILQNASEVRYVSSGHLLFAREGVLYAVGFDIDNLVVRGQPVAVLNGVAGDRTTGAVHFSVANNGTLAYVPGSTTSGTRGLAWVDKAGNTTPINIQRGQLNDLRISPDGSRVALLQGSSGSGDVWVYDFGRATFTRLTFTGTNATPVWSANGKDIYYVSSGLVGIEEVSTIFRKPADGSREAEALVSLKRRTYLKAILADGQTALVDTNVQTSNADILQVKLIEGAQPVPIIDDPFNSYAAAVSYDGRYLAYQSSETGRPEIYVRDLSPSGGRWQISTEGGEEPHWSPDGRELYYHNNSFLLSVPIDARSGFQAGTAKSLFSEVYDLRSNTGVTFDVDPRGGRFLMIRPPKEENSAQVRVVLNWFGELRRLAPAQ